MAEGFELCHIPQQSRRDKLRVVLQNHHTSDLQGCAGLGILPLYDQSSQNLLACANIKSSLMASDSSNASDYRTARAIMDNISNESSDLQSVRDPGNDHCNFFYRHQDLRFIQHHDQSPFHGGDFVALSLSSQYTHNGTPPPVELNLHSYGGGDDIPTAVMNHGLYTGYASILKGSKFLKPAKQLLDETCDVGFRFSAEKFPVNCGLIDPPPLDNLRTSVDDPSCGGAYKRKRSTLICLLDEVYKMYKYYYQQIQTIIASFETVAGLSNAAPFANLDIKAMSKHFHSLKNAITEQLQFSVKPHISYGKKEFMVSANFEKGHYGHMGFVEHQPVWRPQRGLPKRAVTVLRSWLFDHFLHPYPTDTDKQLLAKQTGLTRNQVSNWFINARVRLWKPMVEEVHTLETRQAHKLSSHIQQQEASCVSNSFSYPPMNQEPPSKRTRNDFMCDNKYNNQHIMEGNNEHMMNFHNNLSIHNVNSQATANRGVPLTLGLCQNNNIFTLSEAFPLNADGGSRRFVGGGLDMQNRQAGRELIGDQFLHDIGG
ncbi:unnamed protein product [Lactuca virosa]|uniref:Homeobox domain-containing protein n=1 Tax=Lactuca virosa TaxID=75947 RepID=A0AAU9P6E8_9ASTR|nr:unnamed protein product [Lactuca virosa]